MSFETLIWLGMAIFLLIIYFGLNKIGKYIDERILDIDEM